MWQIHAFYAVLGWDADTIHPEGILHQFGCRLSHSQLCAVLFWLSGFETINQQVFDRFHNTSISWPCIVLICQVVCYITYIHTYIHTYVRTYVHTYVHTYIHPYIHTSIHTSLCPVSRVDPPGPLNWYPCLCLYLYPILVVVRVITISSTVVFLPPPQPHHQHPQVHSRVGGYHNMMEESPLNTAGSANRRRLKPPIQRRLWKGRLDFESNARNWEKISWGCSFSRILSHWNSEVKIVEAGHNLWPQAADLLLNPPELVLKLGFQGDTVKALS